MSFDKATRNALAKMVGQARERLKSDVMDQLRRLGFQADGTVLDLDAIAGLTENERDAARELRSQLAHFISLESGSDAARRQAAYDRLAREIGFTTLNRLVALRMAEERGLIIESIGQGLSSRGFLVYERVARDALGTRAETYCAYLELLYDELALDLPLLFDRTTPESRIFPGERCLEEVLALLNNPDLARLWSEDEAIGWVYQYYNDPAERKKMRDASQAPRNSRELAIRNQFFTPRYVVEFLTDNTLGRIWYEMRHGETRLTDDCRYLVRRKHPIWLPPGQLDLRPFDAALTRLPEGGGEMWTRPNSSFETWDEIQRYALTLDGYAYAQVHGMGDAGPLANSRLEEFHESGAWRGGFEELRVCLFFEQRRWRHFGDAPEGDDLTAIQALYTAICDAWDREADVIAYRPKKDPRDLKILDPACGSGHFLLYAFDLLATIYEEAWEDALSPAFEVTSAPLRDDYPSRDALRREMPGLILRHNLHGVDIDPRACQIAGLALWLRAQRSYQQLSLRPAERPPISRSNIVCAEPMPGEREMLGEYLRQHVDPRLHDLVRTIWGKMQLAGEAGTLLKIEEEIEVALREARDRAMVDVPPLQISLFQKDQPVVQERMTFSTAEDRAFLNEAEDKLLAALRDYASQATNGHATQRRLFADDAAQGFAFIDLCRQRFDVVLMNPPFGGAETSLQDYCIGHYRAWNFNLFCAFVERALELLCQDGACGAITDRSYMVKTSYEDYRRQVLLAHQSLALIVDLGWGVLDANVEVNMLVLRKRIQPFVQIVDVSEALDTSRELAVLVANPEEWACRTHDEFSELPNAILSYHLPKWQEQARVVGMPVVKALAEAGSGLKAGAVDRFVRLRWETGTLPKGKKWEFFQNGGPYAPFYYPTLWAIFYDPEWRSVREIPSSRITGLENYGQAGLTYGKRTDFIYAYTMPSGQVFSNEGMAVFPIRTNLRWATMAFINSAACQELMNSLAGQHKAHSYFNKMYLPLNIDLAVAGIHAEKTFHALQTMGMLSETDPMFVTPLERLCNSENSYENLFGTLAELWSLQAANAEKEAQISNSIVNDTLGIGDTGFCPPWPECGELYLGSPGSTLTFVALTLQYAIGIACGRWDIRIGGAPSLAPKLADPFAPLPVCAPGALVGPDGLPATPGCIVSEEWLRARPDVITLPLAGSVRQPTTPDEEYPVSIAWDGILVDDPEHPADIVRRVREVLGVLWPSENGARTETIEREACEILGVRELRDYFRKPSGFFEDHLKRYSKSRRQAPIYWPLSTASGSYTLWIYYHRLTSDTMYTAVNRYVEPKIADVRRQVAEDERALEVGIGREASRLRASIEQEQAFLRELQDFRDELLRMAALPYQPNLNDGVIITAAPLHRLFRLSRWAKDTKACWEKLERGEYDWTHLAYTLWPDRVRAKCRTDKSLAIAHDLEDLYVEPPATAKKGRGRKPAQVAEEVELIEVRNEEE